MLYTLCRELGGEVPEGDSRQEAVLVMLGRRVEVLKEKLKGLEKEHQQRLTAGGKERRGRGMTGGVSIVSLTLWCSIGPAEEESGSVGREETGVEPPRQGERDATGAQLSGNSHSLH